MRELASAVYWTVTGGLMTFGFLGLMSIGLPFLLVGLVMAVFGLLLLKLKGIWAITVGFGTVPAYIVLSDVLRAAGSSGPPCTEEGEATLAATTAAGERAVSCSPTVSDGYVAMLVFFGVIVLSGPTVRLLMLARGRFS